MLKRLSSAISTAHAISLAIREAPDAIRDLSSGLEWRKWAQRVAGAEGWPDEAVMDEVERKFANDVSSCRAQITEEHRLYCEVYDSLRGWEAWAAEELTRSNGKPPFPPNIRGNMEKLVTGYAAEITEARELLSGLSSGLGYGLGGEDESLPSMIERIRDGITETLKVMIEMRDAAQNRLDAWCNWGCGFSGVYGTDAEIRSAMESEVQKIINHWTGVCNEWRDKCEAAQNERDELKTRVENQASEIAALRNRVTELVCERDDIKSKLSTVTSEANELARTIEAERREYQAKLARHEAAERWRRVTGSDSELPTGRLRVLYRLQPTDPELIGRPTYDRCGPFEWRYLSSQDVPQ